MHMMFKMFLLVMVLTFSTEVLAGKKVTGKGETPELACWDHDFRANEHARHRTTCYRSCRPKKAKFDGQQYYYSSSVPNHQGSCRNSKYNRDYLGKKSFLSKYPKPGSSPAPASPDAPDLPEPKWGINIVEWRAGVPSSERARLVIRNNTNERGITVYEVSVRDSRYSFPARVIERGEVVLEPNTSWGKEFHQWGAADWSIQTQ